jgi:uncharacterized SAM-binding protein YcdF (DUF218 family)
MLSTVVTALFFSPLLFVIAFLAAVALFARGRQKAGLAVAVPACALLFLLSIEPVHDAIILPLENGYPPLSGAQVEAVVVLGGGTYGSAPDLQGRTGLTPEALKRLVSGATLARARGVPLFLTGGKVEKRTGESEAGAAARELADLGIPQAAIRVEEKSRTTWENARFLAPMLESAGIRTVALVTSAYHMPRGALAFRKAGIDFIPAPTDYRTQRTPYTAMSFIPSFQTLRETFGALREYVGLLQYSLMQ